MGNRTAMGIGLAALNRLGGWNAVDRIGLRKPMQNAVFQASRTGFRSVGAVNRAFGTVNTVSTAKKSASAPTRLPSAVERTHFDLTPSDEQQMIREATLDFATEQLRPAASAADTACSTEQMIVRRSVSELGITLIGIPESLGGLGTERSATTNVLVAEALAHGDMGQAMAILAPAAVSGALVLWGDEAQQSTYLPCFTADSAPAAALAVLEPRPLFDPFSLSTRARRVGDGFVLDGVKSLVPRAAEAELFVIAAVLGDH